MKLLVLLIGMVFIVEGLPYVAAPEFMKGWLTRLSETEPSHLRLIGLLSMAFGLLVCFIVQKTTLIQ